MNSAGYGSASNGQRLPAQQTYEAPACVQNAMMTKDKKPFTYTPGGIDLSQIKSERMAKRLARNAQAEGATGASQQNRPTQPQSPGSGGNNPAANMGAAAMGMPFQVLPPPPPPPMAPQMSAGKKTNGGPAPPPPPPPSSNTQNTLAPPTNGSKPGSPNAARKSPTPQRFEPPPLGFRPEIKIPPNPMATLRKVPPPVEKNTFWKDEYVKDRSKSPMVDDNDRITNSPNNGNNYGENNNIDTIDALKKSMPTTTNNQQPETNNYNNNNINNYNQQYAPQQTIPQQPTIQAQQYSASPQTPPQQQQHLQPHQQQSPRPEFRSVAAPQSPAVNIYTRQTDSPRSDTGTATPPQRATESPFKFAQQQQHQQQARTPTISPLAQQQQQPQAATTPIPIQTTNIQQAPAQTVPWRTQRGPQQTTPAQPQQQLNTHPQPIYNNVQQRSRDVLSPAPEVVTLPQQTQQSPQFQGAKPTSVGSLYIAPLAPPTEPQAQNIVRQQLQQQQQQRDSPMRQLPQQQQQQQQLRQPAARWMTSQPMSKEQPEWARPEENCNVVPSSLQRMKSPPPPAMQQQQQQPQYQTVQGNGYIPTIGQNFGAHGNAPTGLRLQINTTTNTANQSGPKERIIPIQLEQTPTYTPGQPSFNTQNYGPGSANAVPAPAGYVIRSPNQFVDQGYNNYPAASQQQPQFRESSMQPTQPLNAPRMIQQQQQQQQAIGGPKTRIVPISLENDGTRGPISQAPIVMQNDPRSPPVQSKSFRILQKITDTVDDGTSEGTTTNINNNKNDNYMEAEPQLQRPTFAKQMSVQQARNSPTIEQMRRMQIAHDQQQQPQTTPAWNQGNSTPQPNRFAQQQRPAYNNNDMPQQYIHPSEQQVPEPKKYTGSAIPSRSFKILQAMTTPENAGPGQSDL